MFSITEGIILRYIDMDIDTDIAIDIDMGIDIETETEMDIFSTVCGLYHQQHLEVRRCEVKGGSLSFEPRSPIPHPYKVQRTEIWGM